MPALVRQVNPTDQLCCDSARPTDGTVALQPPAAAGLTLARVLTVLAARVGLEQLARIEPVNRSHLAEHRRKVAGKLGILRAAMAPQRASRRH